MFYMSRLHLVYGFIQTGVRYLYLPPPPPPPTPMLSMFFNAIPFEVTSRLRTNFSNDVFHLTNGMEGYSGYLVDQEYSASLVSR